MLVKQWLMVGQIVFAVSGLGYRPFDAGKVTSYLRVNVEADVDVVW